MKIYLVRHGQNEDNASGILNGHRDLPLTEIGRNQAKTVSARIKDADMKFDVVLSSPLIRAKETAEIISQRTGNPTPIIEDLLIERDFGVMTGVESSKVKEICQPDVLETNTIVYFLSPKGAETFPDLIKRAKLLLKRLEAKYESSESILLVGHGDMGKMIYAAYYDLSWENVLTQFHFGNSEMLLLASDSPNEKSHVFDIKQHNH